MLSLRVHGCYTPCKYRASHHIFVSQITHKKTNIMAEAAETKYFSLEIFITVLLVLLTMWGIVHLLGYFMAPAATDTKKA
jgi:hypothetical protein